MKSSILSTAVATALALSVSAANAQDLAVSQPDDWSGNISVMVGKKFLDDSDWPGMDNHGAIGMLLDFKKNNWPVSIAIDLIGTGKEKKSAGNKDEAYSAEMNIGVRKIFSLQDSAFQPYIGAGVASVFAETSSTRNNTVTKYDDTAIGSWVGIGSYYAVTRNFQLGADLRYSRAEVTLNGEDREAGGRHAAISAGYHW